MRYNPNASVVENAKSNNRSEAAVRKYIKVHGIDRRYEQKVGIVNEIRKSIQDNPSVPLSKIAQKTGKSLNTIKKYYRYAIGEEELSKTDTQKVSKIDIRQRHDYYATHPSVVRDLLEVETFEHCILEPCCGGGIMAEEIKNEGYDVEAYDIVCRGYGRQADFLTYKFKKGERDIITNIPYFDVVPFLRRAIELCKQKAAILMPLRYLSSQERFNFYQHYPPSRVYIYTNRICIAKNGHFEQYNKGQNLEIYAWYIWDKSYHGAPIIKWITNVENR